MKYIVFYERKKDKLGNILSPELTDNEFLVKNHFLPETRLYAHGQGYDLVERPAIREDEPMRIKPRMNI